MYRIHTWLAICVCGLSLGFKLGPQTLGQTTWYEKIILQVDPTFHSTTGFDLAAPDAIDDSLTTAGWGASGSVSTGPPGPPQLTAHAYAQRSDGALPDTAVADTKAYVVFQLVVRKTLAPPVSVSTVPVTAQVHGNTSIGGNVTCDNLGCLLAGRPVAFTQIIITSPDTLLDPSITSEGYSSSDRVLNLTKDLDLPVDLVVTGRIDVHSTVQMMQLGLNEWGEATASIAPSFSISPEFIPGTYSRYSDYFELEYSPGYFALGNPTPVQTSTWGKIKAQYLQH